MANCNLRTFDPSIDPSYKKTTADRLIGLRSKFFHSEFEFSGRYCGVSVSATMADSCRCVRFKKIDYEKHPTRWRKQTVPLSHEQEAEVFGAASKMAGVSRLDAMRFTKTASAGDILFDKTALRYDLPGVALSFVLPKWRIWRPHEKWVWCSEFCCLLIQVAFPAFDGRADENTPEDLYLKWAGGQ